MSASSSDRGGEPSVNPDERADPSVSVIMPFLDSERFLEEAIASVVAQTYNAWELLLVDDGSTDASAEIARRYVQGSAGQIRLLQHRGRANLGASASRNLGIRHARGKYIALLDSDDVWLPFKLEEQVPLLERMQDVGAVYGHTLRWYSWTGKPEDAERDEMPYLGVPLDRRVAAPELLIRCLRGRAAIPTTCSLLMRRSAVERSGGFEESFRATFTDQAFYTKLLLNTPVYVADRCWDRYRRHPDSCYSSLESAGRFRAARLHYLEWAAEFLETRGVGGTPVSRAARWELRLYRRQTLYRLWRWQRRVRRRLKGRVKPIIRRTLPARVQRRLGMEEQRA